MPSRKPNPQASLLATDDSAAPSAPDAIEANCADDTDSAPSVEPSVDPCANEASAPPAAETTQEPDPRELANDAVIRAIEGVQEALALASGAKDEAERASLEVHRLERVLLANRNDRNAAALDAARKRLALAHAAETAAANQVAKARADLGAVEQAEQEIAVRFERDTATAAFRAVDERASWAGFRARVEPDLQRLAGLAAELDAIAASLWGHIERHNADASKARDLARRLGISRVRAEAVTLAHCNLLTTYRMGLGTDHSGLLRRASDLRQMFGRMAHHGGVRMLATNVSDNPAPYIPRLIEHGPRAFDEGGALGSAAVFRAVPV